jgi:hypothetical protein
MPLQTSGSVTTEVPDGTQVRWSIKDATFEPDGQYGPDIELELDIITEKYIGTSTRYWARIQQPRLDKVRKLRKEGLDDETIASVLRKQGFAFDKIDEADEMVIGRGGALYSILVARCGGNRRAAEKVLENCDTFDDLAKSLTEGSFVGTTKLSKDGYVRLDATEDIFPDVAGAAQTENAEEDFDDLPFGDDDPPPAF